MVVNIQIFFFIQFLRFNALNYFVVCFSKKKKKVHTHKWFFFYKDFQYFFFLFLKQIEKSWYFFAKNVLFKIVMKKKVLHKLFVFISFFMFQNFLGRTFSCRVLHLLPLVVLFQNQKMIKKFFRKIEWGKPKLFVFFCWRRGHKNKEKKENKI